MKNDASLNVNIPKDHNTFNRIKYIKYQALLEYLGIEIFLSYYYQYSLDQAMAIFLAVMIR